MRAVPVLLAGFLVLGMVPLAASLPIRVPTGVPPLVAGLLPSSGAFSQVTCPGVTSPDPLRPLELCNVRATSTNGPANEISMAMDPKDAKHLVVVAKGYNTQRILTSGFLTGAVITPYSTTFDGGKTWTEGFLQAFTPDYTLPILGGIGHTKNWESDPVVTFAPDGSVLVVTLRTNNGGGLPIYRSTDGGRTFAQVSMAYTGGTDKEWIAGDPVHGRVYVTTLGGPGMVFMSSADNGLTWSAPKGICGCVFSSLGVDAAGTIHVIGVGGPGIVYLKSSDSGATWTAPKAIANDDGIDWNPGNLRLYRTTNIPNLAVDHGTGPNSGSVYVVWADHPSGIPNIPCFPVPPSFQCSTLPDWQVYLISSRDGGQTWSAPKQINDDPTGVMAHFMPQVAVSPKGDVHVSWLDQRNDPSGLTYQAFYAHSKDGVTWDPNVLVSDLPGVAELGHHQSIQNLAFVGDYMGIQASDDRAVLSFPDARYGEMDAFVATIV